MKTLTNLKSILWRLFALAILGFSSNAMAVYPCVDITKEVSGDGGLTWHDANTETEAVSITNDALYRLTIKRCDYDGLVQVEVSDGTLNFAQMMDDFPYVDQWDDYGNYIGLPDLDSEARSIIIDAPGICSTFTGSLLNTATVTAIGQHREWYAVSDSDDAWIRCEPVTTGGEGCTPGYWKQPHHFDSWPAGITPDMAYSDIFGRLITIRVKGEGLVTDPTLLQALSALGGKVNTAARHSTAAYLNAMTADVSYDLTADQIIDNLQQSIDGNDFGTLIEALVNFNEQGCPLN